MKKCLTEDYLNQDFPCLTETDAMTESIEELRTSIIVSDNPKKYLSAAECLFLSTVETVSDSKQTLSSITKDNDGWKLMFHGIPIWQIVDYPLIKLIRLNEKINSISFSSGTKKEKTFKTEEYNKLNDFIHAILIYCVNNNFKSN